MATLSARMSRTMESILPKLGTLNSSKSSQADVIDLASADNALCQDEVQEIVRSAIQNDLLAKSLSVDHSFGGDEGARISLASFFNTYFRPKIPVSAEHVVLTAGAGPCIEALSQSICDEGDSVILPAPYWYSFDPYLYIRPKVNVVVARTPGYLTHFDDVILAIRRAYDAADDKTRIKAVILTNPHNPFSKVYSKDTIRACMSFCHSHGIHFISDEVYALAALVEPRQHTSGFVSALAVNETEDISAIGIDHCRTHIIWSPGKLFGISGLRIGCLVSQANPQLVAAVSLLTYLSTSSLSVITLKSLLSSPSLPSLISLNAQRLSTSYALFAECFTKLGIDFLPPTDGLFIFAKLGKETASINEEKEFFDRLHQFGVVVSPGRLYDKQSEEYGWARVTISIHAKTANIAIERLQKALK